jgi:hypothetical protein
VLKASSWCVYVLFKLDHQIDRHFPPMNCRFIRRCCRRGFSSPIHPTQLGTKGTIGSSYGVNSILSCCVVYQLHRCYAPMVPSVHPTVYFLFLSLLGFDLRKIDYLLSLACGIFASLGPMNVYKDMLNNMVSLIDHVVMNHQNHTRTNGI